MPAIRFVCCFSQGLLSGRCCHHVMPTTTPGHQCSMHASVLHSWQTGCCHAGLCSSSLHVRAMLLCRASSDERERERAAAAAVRARRSKLPGLQRLLQVGTCLSACNRCAEGEGGGSPGLQWVCDSYRLRLACLKMLCLSSQYEGRTPSCLWRRCLIKSRMEGLLVLHTMPVLGCCNTPAPALGAVPACPASGGFLPVAALSCRCCCAVNFGSACFRGEPACLWCLCCLPQTVHCCRLCAWTAD